MSVRAPECKPRHWWDGPRLRQWKMMVATGDYRNPFALFPYLILPGKPWFVEWSQGLQLLTDLNDLAHNSEKGKLRENGSNK
jgi:hypothetical protein